jgi:hypothetical protein
VCEKHLPRFSVYIPRSVRARHKWLRKLCFVKRRFKKGLYTDVHEHPVVVAYRQKVFLPFMRAARMLMTLYEVRFDLSVHVIAVMD